MFFAPGLSPFQGVPLFALFIGWGLIFFDSTLGPLGADPVYPRYRGERRPLREIFPFLRVFWPALITPDWGNWEAGSRGVQFGVGSPTVSALEVDPAIPPSTSYLAISLPQGLGELRMTIDHIGTGTIEGRLFTYPVDFLSPPFLAVASPTPRPIQTYPVPNEIFSIDLPLVRWPHLSGFLKTLSGRAVDIDLEKGFGGLDRFRRFLEWAPWHIKFFASMNRSGHPRFGLYLQFPENTPSLREFFLEWEKELAGFNIHFSEYEKNRAIRFAPIAQFGPGKEVAYAVGENWFLLASNAGAVASPLAKGQMTYQGELLTINYSHLDTVNRHVAHEFDSLAEAGATEENFPAYPFHQFHLYLKETHCQWTLESEH